MKKVLAAFLLVTGLIGLTAFPSLAADVTAAVDINSAYVWRGQTFNDGAVAQPSIDITKGGFNVNVWGNYDIDDYNKTLDDGEFSEVDLTLSYTHSIGIADIGAGYIEYIFPKTNSGGAPGTREIFISLGLNLPAGFSTGLTYYYDFDETKEYYTVLSAGYGYDFTEQLSLELGASIAYAGKKYCADSDDGFYDYTLSASLGYSITDDLGVSLNATYVDAADDDKLTDVSKGGKYDTDFIWGVSISYSF